MHTFRTDAHLVLGIVLQETLDTATRKLYTSGILAWDPYNEAVTAVRIGCEKEDASR